MWMRNRIRLFTLMRIRIRNERRDHISKSLGTIFWLKNTKFFYADPDPGSGIFWTLDPGSGMKQFGSRIRDKHPGSVTLVLPSRSTVQRSPCPRGRCTSGPGRSGAAQS
jgi:hypothetical protein